MSILDNLTGPTSIDAPEERDLMAPIPLRELQVATSGNGGGNGGSKKIRKVYLVHPTAGVVGDGFANPGDFYVEGDPDAVNDKGEPIKQQGRNTRELELIVKDRGQSRDFSTNKNGQQIGICWSSDTVTGRPNPVGQAAPYNIAEGQLCASCIWQRRDTAIDPASNGYCSLVRLIYGLAEDKAGEMVFVKMSLKNTAGGAGDKVHNMFPKYVKNGMVQPFKVKFTSARPMNEKTKKPQPYFVPQVVEIGPAE